MKTSILKLFSVVLVFCSIIMSTSAQEVEPLTAVAGGKLHSVKSGDGPYAVIFEAGFVSDLSVWQRVAPSIAKNAQILIYSRAGVGKSPARDHVLNLTEHVEDLKQLIASHQITKPLILVGHSYGGWVVRQFAAAHPKLVAGLVLVDPAIETLEVELNKIDAKQVQQDQQRLSQMAPPSAKADLALVQAIFTAAKLPNQSALPDVPTVLLTSVMVPRNPFFQETAPALRVKRDLHQQFLQQFSNSSHVVTSRSGHHIQMEEPHLVVAAIEQVITGLQKESEKVARQLAKQQARLALNQAIEKTASQLQAKQEQAAESTLFSALKTSQFAESEINQLAYDLLNKAKQAVLAEMVFRYNVKNSPQSDNAHDSHGESLLALNRVEEAKAAFNQAIALGTNKRSPEVMRGYQENLQKAEKAAKPAQTK
ncbi:MAG: alpha/beta fold hydrolase [Undibacterium sp.]|nr:alpha/beta fold hydrolase [Undibacterium sp.]